MVMRLHSQTLHRVSWSFFCYSKLNPSFHKYPILDISTNVLDIHIQIRAEDGRWELNPCNKLAGVVCQIRCWATRPTPVFCCVNYFHSWNLILIYIFFIKSFLYYFIRVYTFVCFFFKMIKLCLLSYICSQRLRLLMTFYGYVVT